MSGSDEMVILKAGFEAMFNEPWDGTQAPMMGAAWDAMRKAAETSGSLTVELRSKTGDAGSTPVPRHPSGPDEYGYAVRLARALAAQRFPGQAFVPLPTLMGVLTQIDNITAALTGRDTK